MLLAILRGATLTLLLLLLFNPALPGAARRAAPLGTVVVLDASLSMQTRDGGQTRWQQALELARAVPDARQAILMGGEPRVVSMDSIAGSQPNQGGSRLLPALQAAAEGGASRVVIITDGAIEDENEVRRWLPRLGVDVELKKVGGAAANDRAIAELNAPAWAEAGKPVKIRLGVTSSAGSGSVRALLRSGGVELGSAEVPAAGAGRIAVAELEFTPTAPDGGGLVRFEIALAGEDAIAENNRRVFYLFVGDKPAGVALVSLSPDWEPRFLHPVMVQALGLPVRSFLRANATTYMTGGPGTEAGQRVTEEAVRSAVADADLLVLHGARADMPEWIRTAVAGKPRVLVLPHESGLDVVGISLTAATPGDWFVAPEIPPSPIAGVLAGAPLENLTPLLGVHLARDLPSGAWTPLIASRGRRGASTPIAAGVIQGNRRVVVAMAAGFWRWAFRGGEQRQTYARFWGALAGWLVQERAQVASGAVRPTERVFERGRPLAWVTPGASADSIRLRLRDASGIVADTAIPLQQGDTAFSGQLPPGEYRYEARVFDGGTETGSASGAVTVDTYSSEYARPVRALDGFDVDAASLAVARGGSGARPLRGSVWPYVLLTVLLATEWVLRRRWGLR